MIPVFKISLPEYTINTQPDFSLVGNKIDTVLKDNFIGKDIVVRALGSQEHSGEDNRRTG
jgi:hypothetical protein